MKEKIFEGFLTTARNHPSVLWSVPFDKNQAYYPFPDKFISKFHLPSGVRITCEIENKKVTKLHSICGVAPDEFSNRKSFNSLVPIHPTEKFAFGNSDSISLRILDLLVPIGKGTRGLIVSPPRAGKTMLLETLANGIQKLEPKMKVIVLLIDERPEEVTSFIQNTQALVFHSSLDKGTASHVLLSNFLIKQVQTEIECGNDIVLLIDSLTRMGRAYNVSNRNDSGRIMSGGISAGALELPRKLFGLARKVQAGGSCTILATLLKDTGSRMDEVIFQEFKGTGNCEIVLDRDIAEERLFPAINIAESGTRKEELLHSVEEMEARNILRRKLLKMDKITAVSYLIDRVSQHKSNKDLFRT